MHSCKQDPSGNARPNLRQDDSRMRRPSNRPKPSSKQAKRDLDQAKLNLRYCDVVAEIDGVVTRRNVNPGNNVQAGQKPDGRPLAHRNLDQRQLQRNPARRPANRPARALRGRHVRQPARIRGPHHRLHHGHRPDPRAVAAAECDRQLRQDRAAAAGSNRAVRLRPRKGPVVRRACRSSPTSTTRNRPTGPAPANSCSRFMGCPKARASQARAKPQPGSGSTRNHRRLPNDDDNRASAHRFLFSSTSQELLNEQRGRNADRNRPPGDQPLGRRRRRGRAHLHGSAGYDHRQRRAAVHRRRPLGGQRRQRVGAHELPGGQRHHPADLRLALGSPRPPQLLPASIAVFTIASGLCGMATTPSATDPVPRDPGPGRRRASALQPGHPPRRLSARKARRGHDHIRHRRLARARRRPDAGRLPHRQLQLALDLLHQHPRRRTRPCWLPTSWSRTPTISRPSGPNCGASRSTSITSAWGC